MNKILILFIIISFFTFLGYNIIKHPPINNTAIIEIDTLVVPIKIDSIIKDTLQ